jgi:hypothetical protein
VRELCKDPVLARQQTLVGLQRLFELPDLTLHLLRVPRPWAQDRTVHEDDEEGHTAQYRQEAFSALELSQTRQTHQD